jgi:transposase
VTELEHAPLTREEAVLLTNQIQKAITLAWDLIVRAYHGRAWDALGYSSWDKYCEGEFGHARLALPAEDRRERIRSLREHGLSTRAIASATGVSQWTVRDDLDRSRERNLSPEITGIDGKNYGATTEVIDAEIVEEEDGVADQSRATRTRVALPKQFGRPVGDVHRAARRLAELSRDDRFNRNAALIADLYLPRLIEAQDAIHEAITAIEKRNGVTP